MKIKERLKKIAIVISCLFLGFGNSLVVVSAYSDVMVDNLPPIPDHDTSKFPYFFCTYGDGRYGSDNRDGSITYRIYLTSHPPLLYPDGDIGNLKTEGYITVYTYELYANDLNHWVLDRYFEHVKGHGINDYVPVYVGFDGSWNGMNEGHIVNANHDVVNTRGDTIFVKNIDGDSSDNPPSPVLPDNIWTVIINVLMMMIKILAMVIGGIVLLISCWLLLKQLCKRLRQLYRG